MEKSTIIGAVAGFAGALVIGTVAVANAGTSPTPGPTGRPTGQSFEGWGHGHDMPGGTGTRDGEGGRGGWGGAHTEVTGTELAKVRAAVTAKDKAVTVERAHKDADGSYDVFGTKAGSPVMVEVSKDLATVEVRQGRGERDGRHGGHTMGTEVDAATLTKITAAVRAKDAAITVEHARVMPDGSYGAMGTKGGNRVMVHLSKDLKTVDVMTGVPGMHGHGFGHDRGADQDRGPGATSPSSVPTASGTASAPA